MPYKDGKYGLTDKQREVTARFVHRVVLPSGLERWIIAQYLGNDTYLAPIRRNNRKKIMFDSPHTVFGTLQYIYGTAPDFNRKFDAQKAVLTYFDIDGMIRKEEAGEGVPEQTADTMPVAKIPREYAEVEEETPHEPTDTEPNTA